MLAVWCGSSKYYPPSQGGQQKTNCCQMPHPQIRLCAPFWQYKCNLLINLSFLPLLQSNYVEKAVQNSVEALKEIIRAIGCSVINFSTLFQWLLCRVWEMKKKQEYRSMMEDASGSGIPDNVTVFDPQVLFCLVWFVSWSCKYK